MNKLYIQLFLIFLLPIFPSFVQAQSNCCQVAACHDKAMELKNAIVPLLAFVGKATPNDAAASRATLELAQQRDPLKYASFKSALNELINFSSDVDQDECFKTLVSQQEYLDINNWRIYFHDLTHPVTFPSPEFCSGFGLRAELSQGSIDFLRNSAAYLGSVRGLMMYTFGKRSSCGNHWRLLLGPQGSLRNNIGYVLLDSRISYRLKDLMIKKPPIFFGSLNLFGEYVTNFRRFDYVGIGAEAQLGWIGLIQLSFLQGMHHQHQGFQFGVFISTKNKR